MIKRILDSDTALKTFMIISTLFIALGVLYVSKKVIAPLGALVVLKLYGII